MRKSLRRTVTAGAALFLLLGLSACGSEQSVAEACAAIKSEMSTQVEETGSALTTAAADLQKGGNALNSVTGKFSDTAASVTNPEVKKSVADFADVLGDLTTAVQKNAKDPANATDDSYGTLLTSLTDATTAYTKLCAA